MSGSQAMQSTEILTDNGWKSGVPLPKPVHSHCMVLLNLSAAIVIGGFSASGDYLSDTYILDTTRQDWLPGPNLSIGRMSLR